MIRPARQGSRETWLKLYASFARAHAPCQAPILITDEYSTSQSSSRPSQQVAYTGRKQPIKGAGVFSTEMVRRQTFAL